MNQSEGWIKVHRKILDSRVFQNEGLLKVWLWCLLQANHQDRWISVKTGKGMTEVLVTRGQFIFGRESAAKKLRMKPSTVQDRMKKLANMQNLVTQSVSHYSIVTVCNYENYQGEVEERPSENPTPIRHPSVSHPSQTRIKKNENKKEYNPLGCLFKKFWMAYPKKKSKGQAEKAFSRINPDEQLLETMISKIERATKSEDWIKENGKFIPHPATWLNAKGWEDEPTETKPEIEGDYPKAEDVLRRQGFEDDYLGIGKSWKNNA